MDEIFQRRAGDKTVVHQILEENGIFRSSHQIGNAELREPDSARELP
jgi:hypothetical protein